MSHRIFRIRVRLKKIKNIVYIYKSRDQATVRNIDWKCIKSKEYYFAKKIIQIYNKKGKKMSRNNCESIKKRLSIENSFYKKNYCWSFISINSISSCEQYVNSKLSSKRSND